MKLRVSHAHEEGCDRRWSVMTTALTSSATDGKSVTHLNAQRVTLENGIFSPLKGSDFQIPADLVLLAMGFSGHIRAPFIDTLGLEISPRGNLIAPLYQTVFPGVFVAGDARRGASLIVWAIAEGRKMAEQVGKYLT